MSESGEASWSSSAPNQLRLHHGDGEMWGWGSKSVGFSEAASFHSVQNSSVCKESQGK